MVIVRGKGVGVGLVDMGKGGGMRTYGIVSTIKNVFPCPSYKLSNN